MLGVSSRAILSFPGPGNTWQGRKPNQIQEHEIRSIINVQGIFFIEVFSLLWHLRYCNSIMKECMLLQRDNSKSYGQVCGHKEKCWKTTDSWVDEKSWNRLRSSGRSCLDDGKNIRFLEMDSEKGIFAPKRRARNLFHTTNLALVSDTYSQTLTPTKNSAMHHSGPIHRKAHQSYSPPEGHVVDETPFCTANNSPLNFSGSSRESSSKKSPFTPSKSDGSRSYVSAYSDCPNYMAYTESSKAKVRSLSAPKQRTRYERSGSAKLAAQRASGLHASFTNKANPGYDRLASLPLGYRYWKCWGKRVLEILVWLYGMANELANKF